MKIALGMLAFLLVLASCGKNRPGNQDAYVFGSSDCSSQFINEYNSMIDQAAFVSSQKELDTYRTRVTDFKTKYAGVRCDASVKGERQTIDASAKSDELLKLIDELKGR